MSRLAPVLAVALALLRAAPAGAEPLDLDLVRLGPPDPQVWVALGANQTPAQVIDPATAEVYANDAKKRFGILASELAMALSGPLLTPASTTGHAGFDVTFEAGWQPVHAEDVGIAALGFETSPWPTRSEIPGSVTTTGLRVRKALPFSFELGARATYLNKTSYFATQGELKWALNEGFESLPDLAVRIAHTRVFGQKELNLGETDVDVTVSKRWGVSGVTSFTPYLAARFGFVRASSEQLDFGWVRPAGSPGTPSDRQESWAAFPSLRLGLFRTTLGVRMTASAVSLALEATYFAGKSYSGKDVPAPDEYPDFSLDSSLAAAFHLGFAF